MPLLSIQNQLPNNSPPYYQNSGTYYQEPLFFRKRTDKPVNGGSYVKDTNYAHECYNFDPEILEDEKEYCLGFTQLLGGKDPQLHIEHIVGCKGMKDALSVDNVIVVFCSKAHNSKTMRVVGFYKNATVFRDYQECVFPSEDGNDFIQYYSFLGTDKCFIKCGYGESYGAGFKPRQEPEPHTD